MLLVYVFATISCLCLAALWSPVGKGLTSSLGSLVCDVFLCFVTFPYGVLDQVWYLIVSIPGRSLLFYFFLTFKHMLYISEKPEL